jgi:hypothetical protein
MRITTEAKLNELEETAKYSGDPLVVKEIRGNSREQSSSEFPENGVRSLSDLEEPPEPNDPSELPKPMNNIDKLTLELLINKSQYKKYVQKTDPAKYSENQIYLEKIERYRYKIEQMFSTLMENPEQQITTDVNREFSFFMKTCIQYFELKEMENTSQDHNGDHIDDETLFGNMNNNNDADAASNSSLWGNKIQKSGCGGVSTYMPKYTMDSYVRTKKS